jgi:hypothetical protein
MPDKRFCFDSKRPDTNGSDFQELAFTEITGRRVSATYHFWSIESPTTVARDLETS